MASFPRLGRSFPGNTLVTRPQIGEHWMKDGQYRFDASMRHELGNQDISSREGPTDQYVPGAQYVVPDTLDYSRRLGVTQLEQRA